MVVIGGGPVGSYVAYKMAGMGNEVVVLERKQRVGEQVCCTGIIGQECVSSFDIDSNVVLRQANSAKLVSPSGKLLRLQREETQAYILDRAAFDTAMASRAQDSGAEYILDSPVSGIEIGGDRVRVETSNHEGRLNFEARAAVIAAGFGSRLVAGLGLGRVGDFAHGVQAEVETTGIKEIKVYFGREIAPRFFAWLVPTSPRMAWVGLMSRNNPGHYLRKLMSSLLTQGEIVTDKAELNYGGIPLKPLAKAYSERLIVVGNAAGQVKPISGGGIYYGLLCAEIAADTLHRALKSDDLSVKSLAKYERGWRRKLGWELKTGYWARKVFERLSDRQIDRIFDIVKANGIDETLLKAKDLSFDWHSQAILGLMGHKVVSKAINVMKIPSKAGEKTVHGQ